MVIYNNICEQCRNMEICSIWKKIKNFSEDYAKTPYPVDIEIKECKTFIKPDYYDDNDDNGNEE